jgi:hypothetical protein
MHGERRNLIDRSTQRQFSQSQHGSDQADVQDHPRLSVPAVALTAHARLSSSLGESSPIEVSLALDHNSFATKIPNAPTGTLPIKCVGLELAVGFEIR